MKILVESSKNNSALSKMLKAILEEFCKDRFEEIFGSDKIAVHHKDGNDDNYSVSNLCLMPNKKHTAYHNKIIDKTRISNKSLQDAVLYKKAIKCLETEFKGYYIDVSEILGLFKKSLTDTIKDDTFNDTGNF